jgi:23S rRNA pseudouridine1911/1915/1917 synthase
MSELAATHTLLRPSRADIAVASLWSISRGTAQRLLHDGRISLHGRKLSSGDRIESGTLTLHGGRSWFVAAPIAVPVLSSSNDHLVVHKPAGLPVHALVPGEPSVVGTVVAAHPEVGGAGPPPDGGLLHRLDNDTSGCLVLARSATALAAGRNAWSTVRKEYLAIVDGDCSSQVIDAPLRHAGARMQVGEDGAAALTTVTAAVRMGDATMVHLVLVGGRHHQLRAHLASVGHPLAGDALYGSSTAGAWHLHAWRVTAPSMSMQVEAPPPVALAAAMAEWQRMDQGRRG